LQGHSLGYAAGGLVGGTSAVLTGARAGQAAAVLAVFQIGGDIALLGCGEVHGRTVLPTALVVRDDRGEALIFDDGCGPFLRLAEARLVLVTPAQVAVGL